MSGNCSFARKGPGSVGFTLIELMITVSIIGILAMIATPKFAALIRKASEGSTKGNMGGLRSALTIYYADMEGRYPVDLGALTVSGKYLGTIPTARTPNYHVDINTSNEGPASTAINNAGGWAYVDSLTDPNFGTLWVNCSDTDTKSVRWTSY